MQLTIDGVKLKAVATELAKDIGGAYCASRATVGEINGVRFVLSAYSLNEANEEDVDPPIAEHNCITESH